MVLGSLLRQSYIPLIFLATLLHTPRQSSSLSSRLQSRSSPVRATLIPTSSKSKHPLRRLACINMPPNYFLALSHVLYTLVAFLDFDFTLFSNLASNASFSCALNGPWYL